MKLLLHPVSDKFNNSQRGEEFLSLLRKHYKFAFSKPQSSNVFLETYFFKQFLTEETRVHEVAITSRFRQILTICRVWRDFHLCSENKTKRSISSNCTVHSFSSFKLLNYISHAVYIQSAPVLVVLTSNFKFLTMFCGSVIMSHLIRQISLQK